MNRLGARRTIVLSRWEEHFRCTVPAEWTEYFLLYSPSRVDKVFEDVLLQDIPYRVVRSNSLLYIQQQTISEKFHCRATPKYWPAKPSQGKKDSMYLRHRKRAFFCQNCPRIFGKLDGLLPYLLLCEIQEYNKDQLKIHAPN